MALTTVQNQMTAMGNSGASYEFVNRIINGAMVIDQRSAGASFTPTTSISYGSCDRWSFDVSQNSKMTVQQNAGSVTPPAGFINYQGCTSSSSYSVVSGDYFIMRQAVEGLNCADLAWGTSNASSVTLSFWVRSSLTGTFGGALRNSAANRSYPFTYTISSASTWEYKTITIAGDTSGTWLTTNGVGINLNFSLGAGTTYSGTAGAWGAANYISATGAQSLVGTNAATWQVTGVQLEKGTTASAFDFRDYTRELALCQRYYETALMGLFGSSFGSANWMAAWRFAVTKRANPTITNGSVITIWDPAVNTYTQSSAAIQASYQTVGGASMIFNTFSGLTTYRPYISQAGSESTALTASAEL